MGIQVSSRKLTDHATEHAGLSEQPPANDSLITADCPVSQAPLRIALLGASLFTNNRGVSALASSLVQLVLSTSPTAVITFFLGLSTNKPQVFSIGESHITIPTVNYRLSPRARISEHLVYISFLVVLSLMAPFRWLKTRIWNSNEFLSELARQDIVCDILGGDSFSDIYGISRFLEGVAPLFLSVLMGKRVVLLPQTYGPYKSSVARYIASFIMRHATAIYSRDEDWQHCIPWARDPWRRRIVFCPDVAFLLAPSRPATPVFVGSTTGTCPFTIGFNVNGLLYSGGYNRKNMFGLRSDYRAIVNQLLAELLSQTPAAILLTPHTYGSPGSVNNDTEACEDAIARLSDGFKCRVSLLYSQHEAAEIKWVIGTCQFFIGSRMHACIAALSQGIPTIGIAYSHKFAGVFGCVGMGNYVFDARSATTEDIVRKTLQAVESRETIRVNLGARVRAAQQDIANCFASMLRKEA